MQALPLPSGTVYRALPPQFVVPAPRQLTSRSTSMAKPAEHPGGVALVAWNRIFAEIAGRHLQRHLHASRRPNSVLPHTAQCPGTAPE